VSQTGDEAVQVLLSLETPDVAAAREFGRQIQALMSGIADIAGDGLQRSGDQMADEFQQAETAALETLQEIEQQIAGELQTRHEASNAMLSGFATNVDEHFGEAIVSLEGSFTEAETQVEGNLSQAIQELAADFGQALQDAEEEITNAIDEGLSKNDEALDQLGPQMQEAADDAAWDYDHPILSTLASIAVIVAGVIVGIVALIVVVVATILAFKVLVLAAAIVGISAAIVKVVLVVGGLALIAYGIYQAYQERVAAGKGGGWATLGMALLDFAGITDIYRAITTPGLSPWERFLLSAGGTFKLAGTLLLVYGAWRFVATGGLRAAWRGLVRGIRGVWRRPPRVESPLDKGLAGRGFRPPTGTRVRPAGVPEHWRIRPTKGEGGVKYIDPRNPHNCVRVMPGDPQSPYPNSQRPYVRWLRNGQSLDKYGNIVPKNSPDAHIPLSDFVYRP
jgi:uncharacterized membrane protein